MLCRYLWEECSKQRVWNCPFLEAGRYGQCGDSKDANAPGTERTSVGNIGEDEVREATGAGLRRTEDGTGGIEVPSHSEN